MFRSLIIQLFLIVQISVAAQGVDNLVVTLQGTVTDDYFQQPVADAKIEVATLKGIYETSTDPLGRYSLQIAMPMDTMKRIASLICTAEEKLAVKDQFFFSRNDTLIERNYIMRWTGPCIDTFAPGYIHFQPHSATLPQYAEDALRSWIPMAVLTTQEHFVIQIEGAVDYDEKLHLSLARIQVIRDLLVHEGIPDSVITVLDLSDQPYYYCRRCVGCIPKFLYGEGDTLSIQTIKDSVREDELMAMRRMVHVSFRHVEAKPQDPLYRPRLE